MLYRLFYEYATIVGGTSTEITVYIGNKVHQAPETSYHQLSLPQEQMWRFSFCPEM